MKRFNVHVTDVATEMLETNSRAEIYYVERETLREMLLPENSDSLMNFWIVYIQLEKMILSDNVAVCIIFYIYTATCNSSAVARVHTFVMPCFG